MSFYENTIKKEEVSANANLDSEGGVITEIYSKIAAKIRSIINHDREEKKENLESKEQSFGNQKTNFLKVTNNFFHSFFNSAQW